MLKSAKSVPHLLPVLVQLLHHAGLADALVLANVDENFHSCVNQLGLHHEARGGRYLKRVRADRNVEFCREKEYANSKDKSESKNEKSSTSKYVAAREGVVRDNCKSTNGTNAVRYDRWLFVLHEALERISVASNRNLITHNSQ